LAPIAGPRALATLEYLNRLSGCGPGGVELEADCAPVGHYGGCGAAGVFQGRKRLPAMPKTSGRILAR
jgi:hypothetical protein